MALTGVHGKSASVTWNAVDISDNISQTSFPRTMDEVETTTYGATAKTFLVGLSDNKLTISGFWDQTASHVDATLAPDAAAGTSRAWTYGPAGTTAGNVKYSGNGYITSYSVEGGVNDAVKFKAEIRITGTVTRGTY